MANTCPFVDVNNWRSKIDEQQGEIIFSANIKLRNKNCKNSVQRTLESSNIF